MSSFAESVGSMAAKEKESDNKRKNSARLASWLNLVGGASGFTALHKVDLGSQVFTVAQIVTYMETLAQDNPKFLTFRLSVVFTQKLSLLVQALVGNPNVTAVDHTTRVFVSDFWDVSPQDNKKPRTTLALYFVVQALRAAATVLDLLISSHPQVSDFPTYEELFAPVTTFMANQASGLDDNCMVHFGEFFFYQVFQSAFFSLVPHEGLSVTKGKVQAVVTATMLSKDHFAFALDYSRNMLHAQQLEVRVMGRVNPDAPRLTTGALAGGTAQLVLSPPAPTVYPARAGGGAHSKKRDTDAKATSPAPSPEKRPKGNDPPPRVMPCRSDLGMALKVPGVLPCSRGAACLFQHCANIRSFIGSYGKVVLGKHIAGLPDSFRQAGGGADLTRQDYAIKWAQQ